MEIVYTLGLQTSQNPKVLKADIKPSSDICTCDVYLNLMYDA